MCVSLLMQEELCRCGAGPVAPGAVCVGSVQVNGVSCLAGAAGAGNTALRLITGLFRIIEILLYFL